MSHSIRSLLFREGQALMRAGRTHEAVEAYDRALREPGHVPTTPTLALALADAAKGGTRPEQSVHTLVAYAASYHEQRAVLLGEAARILQPQWAALMAPLLDAEWRWLVDDDDENALPQLLLAADIYALARNETRALDILLRARRIALATGRSTEIVKRLYEIARSLNSANNLTAAVDVATEIIGFAPDDLRSRFLLCEVLRRRSYPDNSPELRNQGLAVGEAYLRDALGAWGEAASRTDDIESWALSSRGLINEQLARLSGADRWMLGWEGVTYLQRALHGRGYDNVFDCSALARFYRALGLTACEIAMTTRLSDVAVSDDEKRTAAEERIITATNFGDFDTALTLLPGQGNAQWGDAIEAFIQLRRGNTREALHLVQRAITAGTDDAWCLHLRAECYREAGDLEQFWNTCAAIWAGAISNDVDAALSRARAGMWIGLRSGNFTEAAALVKEYDTNPMDTGVGQLAALVDIARGDLRGGMGRLQQVIELTNSARELTDLQRDVRFMAEHHVDATVRDAIRGSKEIEAWFAARAKSLRQPPPTPEDELTHLLRTRPEDDADGWLWIGVQATLARFDFWADRFESAVARYSSILERGSGRFPEAARALETCGNTLLSRADAALREHGSAGDQTIVDGTYKLLAQQPFFGSEICGDAWTALAVLHMRDGDEQAARLAFHSAINSYGTDSVNASTRLGQRLRFLIRSARDFWRIWEAVVGIVPLAFERAELQEQIFEWFGDTYSATPAPADLERLPIVLELGGGLIPEDAAVNWKEWVLFTAHIPELKEWCATEYGLPMKPVRVRGNTNLADDQFAILIDEVPVPLIRSSVRLGRAYVTASPERLREAGVSPADIEEEPHPFTGRPAFWVTWSGWSKAQAAGLLVEEPLRFVIEQLRKAVRDHIHGWIDIDAVDALLAQYSHTAENKTLVDDVLPSQAAHFQFSRLVRALVQQGIPMRDLGEILHAVRGVHMHPAALATAIKTTRLKLRSRLPGNAADWYRLGVPSDIEEQVQQVIHHAGDGAGAARVLTRVRQFVKDIPDDQAFAGITLMTNRYDTADYLRDSLRREFADVTALCREEIDEPTASTLRSAAV